MAEVVLEDVTKHYSSGQVRLPGRNRPGSGRLGRLGGIEFGGPAETGAVYGVQSLNLRVADREFLVLVGPSGCGKSTTLRLIAGLETLSAGRILIGGRVVNRLPPAERDIAMVFQNYALYPHMTVEGNLAFGLRLRYGGSISARLLRWLVNPRRAAELAARRRGIGQRVRQAAERLGITHLLGRKPHELSGGERQRVALGRAIVRDPAAFLFDEPLSNLDAKLRQLMRSELKQLHLGLGATTIYVTHDQVEAMTLGQRVAVLDRGRLQQVGTPEQIYDTPANLFVAKFFGSTPMNLLAGELVETGSELEFVSGPCRWRLGFVRSSRCRHWPRRVTLGVRGEDLIPRAARPDTPSPAADDSLTADRWRFPPAIIRQLDNWGDAQVAELDLVNSNRAGSSGTAATGGNLKSDPAEIPEVQGSAAVAGDGNSSSQGVIAGTAEPAGRVIAKFSGPPSGNWRPGQELNLELSVDRGHWFDSSTGGRLNWQS